MSVEGLRAWIGEVERKLGKRTRVFLALTVIAIGIAGASLYLAIDARNSSVSESDVRALQEELEARIDATATGGATTTPTVPPTELESTPTPQPKESNPKQEGGSKQNQGSGSGTGTGGGSSGSPNANSAAPKSSSGGNQDKSARILELLEQTKQENAEAEAKQKAEGDQNAR